MLVLFETSAGFALFKVKCVWSYVWMVMMILVSSC